MNDIITNACKHLHQLGTEPQGWHYANDAEPMIARHVDVKNALQFLEDFPKLLKHHSIVQIESYVLSDASLELDFKLSSGIGLDVNFDANYLDIDCFQRPSFEDLDPDFKLSGSVENAAQRVANFLNFMNFQ